MTPAEKRIEITLDSVLQSVELAEDLVLRVAGAAGFDEENCHRIGMSVREGVINAVNYGNQQSPDKKVRMSVALLDDKMEIIVSDEGKGFRLEDVPDPLAEENLLKSSGRGLFLIRAFMDEFDLRRSRHGGAELVLTKRYADAPSGRP